MSSDGNLQDNFAKRVAGLLTRATEQLDSGTMSALRHARHAALERQHRNMPALALNTGHHIQWPIPHSPHQWAVVAILLVSILVGSASYWQHVREHEATHLDLAILTDDMPMEVFIDR